MQPLLPTTHGMQHCHSNAICNHSFKKRTELRTQEQPLVAEHRGGTNRVRNDRSRNRRTDEVPFIAGCNHFTRKNTRFRAPASSQKQSPCNIHAAFPMRSATTASRNAQNYAHRNNHSLQNTEEEPIASGTTAAATAAQTRYLSSPAAATLHGKTQGFVLRLPPQNFAHATFMQPFQCDLQPQLQETNKTTHAVNNHSLQNTEEEPIASGTAAAATAAQTRYLSSPAATTLHGKTQGFVLRLPPQNFAHATFMQIMQPFQCDLHPQIQETHRTTHTGTTTRCRTQRRNQSRPERPQPNRRTDEVPFIVGCNHFTRKNTRFRAPASSPKLCPCNIHAAIPMRSASTDSRNA